MEESALQRFRVEKAGRRNVWVDKLTGARWINLGKSQARAYQQIDQNGQPVGSPLPYRQGNKFIRAKLPEVAGPYTPISEKPETHGPDWQAIIWLIPEELQDQLPGMDNYPPTVIVARRDLPNMALTYVYAHGKIGRTGTGSDPTRAGQVDAWASVYAGNANEIGMRWENNGTSMADFDTIDKIVLQWAPFGETRRRS